MAGLIGTKIGMTSIFGEGGAIIPCTVIQAGPCVVTQKKSKDKDGYDAVQLGYGDKKEKNTTKPMKKHFEKSGAGPWTWQCKGGAGGIDASCGATYNGGIDGELYPEILSRHRAGQSDSAIVRWLSTLDPPVVVGRIAVLKLRQRLSETAEHVTRHKASEWSLMDWIYRGWFGIAMLPENHVHVFAIMIRNGTR
jgi:hypothetical protein